MHFLRVCSGTLPLQSVGVRVPEYPQYALLHTKNEFLTIKINFIMATSKLNAVQFAELSKNFNGVMLIYTNQDGKQTAQHFFGQEYEPADKSQDEMFRVWKNVVATFWAVKQEEIKLRADNDGIRSKLRASTPSEIIFRSKAGEMIKSYQLDFSVWSRIGLVPTKKDFERTARDYKKAIHAATKASFDALGFRVELPKEEKTEDKKANAKTEKVVVTAAENKKEEIKEAA